MAKIENPVVTPIAFGLEVSMIFQDGKLLSSNQEALDYFEERELNTKATFVAIGRKLVSKAGELQYIFDELEMKNGPSTLGGRLDFLSTVGLPVVPIFPADCIPGITELKKWTEGMPFKCSGVRVMDNKQKHLTDTITFPDESKIVSVVEVYTVKKAEGVYTPELLLSEDVIVDGHLISSYRVSSFAKLRNEGIGKGAKIVISPMYHKVVASTKVVIPTRCPVCKHLLKMEKVDLVCTKCRGDV